MIPRPAIFLDRDGTILDELGYLADPEAARFLPAALEALARLASTSLPIVVLTNQSGIARGILDETILREIHARMEREILETGGRVDAFYHCPHHPEIGPEPYRADCDCRKPRPGMYLRAANDMGLDLAHSFAVGDTLRDLEAARRAGVPHLLLVLTGKGASTLETSRAELARIGARCAPDLDAAADIILGELAGD